MRLMYLKNVTTLQLDPAQCTGCGTCLKVCPHAVFGLENARAVIQQKDACMECGACARNCKDGAITVQAGVGCANAVINSVIGRNGACNCDCQC